MPALSPLLLAALLGGPAHAKTDIVPVGTSLQDAILDASVGDVLHLPAGTWSACVEVGTFKDITIVGLGGPGSVTLTCADPNLPTLDVQGELVLAGVTLEHTGGNRAVYVTGRMDGQDLVVRGIGTSTLPGAGIYLDDGVVELYGSQLVDLATTSDGGAIYAAGKSRALLLDSEITGGSAYAGGGIFVQNASTLNALGTTFSGSTAVFGGAIYTEGTLVLDGSTIDGNTSTVNQGGGIYGWYAPIYGTDLTVSGNHGSGIWAVGEFVDLYRAVVSGNDAPYGAGIALTAASGYCTACELTENLATGLFTGGTYNLGGGALYLTSGSYFQDQDSTWSGNDAGSGVGGAIQAEAGTSLYLYGSVLDANSAAEGGAAFVATGSSWIQGATFTGNHAKGSGGALHYGTSIYPSLYQSVLAGNSADLDGGAVEVGDYSTLYTFGVAADANTAGRSGGAFHARYGGSLRLGRLEAAGNAAASGGAVSASYGYVELTESWLEGNTATGQGGAVHTISTPSYLWRTRIDRNTATSDGGGLFSVAAPYLTVLESRFCDNAGYRGGGAYLESGGGYGDLIRSSVFQENTATDFGGALWINGYSGGYVDASYNTVVGNDAAAFDGFGVDNYLGSPQYLYTYSSVFAYHGDAGLDTWGFSSRISAGGTLTDRFWSLVGDMGANYQSTDPRTGFTGTGDCDEDLTAYASVSEPGGYVGGWNGAGVGAGTTYWGYDWWADNDGDGWTPAEGDCDDFRAETSPGAPEVGGNGYDDDCSGGDGIDRDLDGWVDAAYGGADCNDYDAAVHPLAAENPTDQVDSDCDGADESLPDQDLDGVPDVDDCAPLDALVSPERADPPYDGIDADCDGDDSDMDNDGFASTVVGGDDCDDYALGIHPDAIEIWYDGTDKDCDGNDTDQDYDGHAAAAVGGDDCDDVNAAISPSAAEIWYDGVDQDCAGDDDFDADADGVNFTLDCNESDPTVHTGAPEIADLKDNDCDASTPEPDGDADGLYDYWEIEHGTGVDDPDTDDDGVLDGVEWGGPQDQAPADTDGDGALDVDDPDSDGDGLLDGDELGDTDDDGADNRVDADDDGDGLLTAAEIADGADDLDGDGAPSWLDPDSDGDGAWDGTDPSPSDAGGAGGAAPPDGPEKYGLGCATTGSAGAGWLGALAILALRRRRA